MLLESSLYQNKSTIILGAMGTIFQIDRTTVGGGGVPSSVIGFSEEKVHACFRSLDHGHL